MGRILYKSEFTKVVIEAENGFLIRVDFLDEAGSVEEEPGEEYLLRQAAKQLDEYFAGRRKKFDLPLKPKGTEFQQKVWQALLEIPYGQTRSYKDIAEAVDCPKGFRAVDLVNNRNPIAIIIPCHRVVGSNGSLVGYAGGWAANSACLHLSRANN